MKIQTFSIIAGSTACNGRCPFCVSRMTAPNGIQEEVPNVNWHNFDKACRLAQVAGVTTAMITGKGEPTLFPKQITAFLQAMQKYNFPLIELQTNGLVLNEKDELGRTLDHELHAWYQLGLTTVAISIVHYQPEKNRKIYCPYKPNYIVLGETIKVLHKLGLSVRLSCIMLKGFIDDPKSVETMIEVAKNMEAEQLTLVPVNTPAVISQDNDCAQWAKEHYVEYEDLRAIQHYLDDKGTLLMELAHGARVYDLGGQNVCISNCLHVKNNAAEMRNLIFFPDGHLRYDWQYQGAILL